MKSFLQLWTFFRAYRKSLMVMFGFGVLMSLCQALLAPLAGYLFDKVFSQSPDATLEGLQAAEKLQATEKLQGVDQFFVSLVGDDPIRLAWAVPLSLVVLYFFNGIFRYIHRFLIRYIGDQVAHDLRQSLHRKFLRLNQNFHANYSAGSGGLLSRTMNDVQTIQNSTGQLAEIVREPVLLTLLLAFMIYMDALLTVILLIAAPVLALFLKQIARSLRKYGRRHQETMEVITSSLKETLDGIKIIQSYNLENKMDQNFDERTRNFLVNRRRIIGREEFAGPISEMIGSMVFAAMAIYFGVHTAQTGEVTSGVAISFVAAMGLLQQPIKKIQNAFIQSQQAIVCIERVMEIINAPDEVPQSTDPKPFPKDWQEIRFAGTGFSYDESSPALHHVDLSVRRGEVIAIVGASGSGKSTLMNLLERFFDASQGGIYLDDLDIRQVDLQELRRNIALVTQDVFLFRESVRTNISYGDLEKEQHSNGKDAVAEAARLANASPFIEKLPENYESPAGERGGFFSGGEKQRISIARAIYKDAPILILDEATSALDSVSEIEVQKGLQELMQGRTAFVIAHRLSTIKTADRILVMDRGQIVEEGSHEDLLARQGQYFQFFQHQSEK